MPNPTSTYRPPNFVGIRTFMRLPHKTDLGDVDIAIVGVPFDTAATHRVGARFGPEGIRSYSMLLRAHNSALGVSVFDHCSAIDYGDLLVTPGYLYDSHRQIQEGAAELFDNEVTPIFLGGDHSISLPLLRAATAKHGPLALVHFDSHNDLGYASYGDKDSHGTPFRRAVEENLLALDHSIQIGLRGPNHRATDIQMSRDLMDVITGIELHEMGMAAAIERIRARVGNKLAYLTFDIDFVDPAFAPGTGTPEVGGFTSAQTLQLIRGLQGLNFVAFDCVEVMPVYDPTTVTCLLAANIVFEFMSLIALQRKKNQTPSIQKSL